MTTTNISQQVLAELSNRYTGLIDDYPRYVRGADDKTLEHTLGLALEDAPSRDIHAALGIDDSGWNYDNRQ